MLQFRTLSPGEATFWSPEALTDLGDQRQPLNSDDDLWYQQAMGFFNPEETQEFDQRPTLLEMTASYRSHLEQLIRMQAAVGAFSRETCLGLAAAEPLDRPGWWILWDCQVKPAFHDHGIGSKLMTELEQQLISQHATNLVAMFPSHNSHAFSFFRLAGYELAGVERLGMPTLMMQKRLAGEASIPGGAIIEVPQ